MTCDVCCVVKSDVLTKQIRPCFGTKFDLIKCDDWNRSMGCWTGGLVESLQHLAVNVDTAESSDFSQIGNINT